MHNPKLLVSTIDSMLGPLLIATFNEELILCRWESAPHNEKIIKTISNHLQVEIEIGNSSVTELTKKIITGYLNDKSQLAGIPYRLIGTPFQCEVCEAVARIPYGETETYSGIAESINKNKSVRAVASAIARNPLELFIPCHRVVPASGAVGKYAGGTEIKRYLLRHEAEALPAFAINHKNL